MNYELSKEILEEVKKANKILLNYHPSPDPDGFGSALALYQVLRTLGKEVAIVGPDDKPVDSDFLPFSEVYQKVVFPQFDLAAYDLLVCLDASTFERAFGGENPLAVSLRKIVIDHHITNDRFGNLNLVDETKSSVAEIVYLLLEDWQVSLDKNVAQCLLTGIIGDTGVFQFSNTSVKTLEIATKLMGLGANKDEIIFNLYRTISFNQVRFWGEVISRMEIDQEYRFVWSAVPYEVYSAFDSPKAGKETAASEFSPIIDGTDFGMVMVEQQKGVLSVSFRARQSFDVSKIAVILGGGGHKAAAGAKVNDSYQEAVNKVLEVTRKVIDENKS